MRIKHEAKGLQHHWALHYSQAVPPLDAYSHMAEFYNPERAGADRGMSLEDKINSGCILEGIQLPRNDHKDDSPRSTRPDYYARVYGHKLDDWN